jgi:hypothetical protein
LFSFCILVAVVIAFIICYAPFHVQRLITIVLDVTQLSLLEKRAIKIFFFISGILYYIGSTVNPIFYHLFSRKYRVACIRTMKQLVHCRCTTRAHSRRSIKSEHAFVIRYSLHHHHRRMRQSPKLPDSIYRLPHKTYKSLDLINAKGNRLRLSMPTYANDRIR